jgi:hypothetical protein
MQRRRWLAVVAGLWVLGCGYHWVSAGSALGPGVDWIEVRPLENLSTEAGMEQVLGAALVEEFNRRGELRAVYGDALNGSGLVLSGAIREVEVRPTAFSSAGLALELEIRVELDLDLSREPDGTPLWHRQPMRLTERFLASAEPGVHESNQEEALQRIAAELAGRVHDALLQSF